MPNIVDKTYFNKANLFNIPLSEDRGTANPALQTPNNVAYLENLCVRIEKNLLINALGLVTYNELQLALADLNDTANVSYKKLVEGEEYEGKVWKGLNYELGFITAKIYETFLTETDTRLSATGSTKANPEGAISTSSNYKIATASQMFYKDYQGGYLFEPIIYENFVDWFGQSDDKEISLYQYLVDKQTNFENFNIDEFKIYDELLIKNSFGI